MDKYKHLLIASGISLSFSALADKKTESLDDEIRYKKIVEEVKEAQKKAAKLVKDVHDSGDLERLDELDEILEVNHKLKDIPKEYRKKYGVSEDGNNYACGNKAC